MVPLLRNSQYWISQPTISLQPPTYYNPQGTKTGTITCSWISVNITFPKKMLHSSTLTTKRVFKSNQNKSNIFCQSQCKTIYGYSWDDSLAFEKSFALSDFHQGLFDVPPRVASLCLRSLVQLYLSRLPQSPDIKVKRISNTYIDGKL